MHVLILARMWTCADLNSSADVEAAPSAHAMSAVHSSGAMLAMLCPHAQGARSYTRRRRAARAMGMRDHKRAFKARARFGLISSVLL